MFNLWKMLQGNGHETQVIEKMIGEGYGDLPRFQSTWSP